MQEFQTIGLLGCGTMVSGIAQVFAASGRDVVVLDYNERRTPEETATESALIDDGVTSGGITEEEKAILLSRINVIADIASLAKADIVVDSIGEDREAKVAILSEVAAVVGEHVPIVINTSFLSVTDLASALPNPSRIAGLHFFRSAPEVRTVEVVTALQTDAGLPAQLVALVESLEGKVPVVVKDRPGFLVNALLMPYLNDVIQEYDDGLATAEDIDLAIRLGLGYKFGPFEMLDIIGIDSHLRATESAYTATRDGRYAPPPLLRQMVAAGRLGAKNGGGFHAEAS